MHAAQSSAGGDSFCSVVWHGVAAFADVRLKLAASLAWALLLAMFLALADPGRCRLTKTQAIKWPPPLLVKPSMSSGYSSVLCQSTAVFI